MEKSLIKLISNRAVLTAGVGIFFACFRTRFEKIFRLIFNREDWYDLEQLLMQTVLPDKSKSAVRLRRPASLDKSQRKAGPRFLKCSLEGRGKASDPRCFVLHRKPKQNDGDGWAADRSHFERSTARWNPNR